MTQRYEVNLMDEHVLRGNTAIIKCHIPSFVADYVYVSSWLQDEQNEISPNNNDFGTNYWSSFLKHVSYFRGFSVHFGPGPNPSVVAYHSCLIQVILF